MKWRAIVKWNLEELTEIQKDKLEPAFLSCTSCNLEDVSDMPTMLLSYISRTVCIPGSELREGEGRNESGEGKAAGPTAAPRQQDETSMVIFISNSTI